MLLKYKINIFFISYMVKLFLYSINCVYLCAELEKTSLLNKTNLLVTNLAASRR